MLSSISKFVRNSTHPITAHKPSIHLSQYEFLTDRSTTTNLLEYTSIITQNLALRTSSTLPEGNLLREVKILENVEKLRLKISFPRHCANDVNCIACLTIVCTTTSHTIFFYYLQSKPTFGIIVLCFVLPFTPILLGKRQDVFTSISHI